MSRFSQVTGLSVFAFSVMLGMLILGSSPMASAADVNATDTLSVTVNISQTTIVDISPNSLDWAATDGALEPGQTGSRKDIQIENMGSINITHIWFNVTQPSTNPFGTGQASNYDAANWITISNDTDSGTYYFPDRKEFNATSRIVYLTDPDGNTPPDTSTFAYGRFRNASSEYFWAVDCDPANNGGFNCTGDGGTATAVYIGSSAHSDTVTGDIDLSDNAGTALTYISASSEDWAYAPVSVNGLDICFATNQWGNVTRWYKWNIEAPGGESCANAGYFVDSADPIVPGASAYARIRVYLPFGVVYDSSSSYSGTLTVLANTV